MRQQQRGEEAIMSQTERSDFTSIVDSSARRGLFDLKTQRTRSWRLPLDGDNSWPAHRCDFVPLFDVARKQLPWKYSATSTVNNFTKNRPFGLHYLFPYTTLFRSIEYRAVMEVI